MTASRRRALVAMLLMGGSFGLAQALKPTTRMADLQTKVSLEDLFPKTFGDWTLDDRMPAQLVSPDAQALLDKLYNETLSRTYVKRGTGERIMLSVAYGGDQSDATRAHRPEVCYPAQGFQMLSTRDSLMQTQSHPLRVRQLVMKLGARTEPVSYWVVVGEHIALSGTDQKIAQLRYSVRGLIPDGMLVRVSNIDNDAAESFALHQDFVRQLSQAVRPDLAPRIFGSTGA
jgi:EpsI family protein